MNTFKSNGFFRFLYENFRTVRHCTIHHLTVSSLCYCAKVHRNICPMFNSFPPQRVFSPPASTEVVALILTVTEISLPLCSLRTRNKLSAGFCPESYAWNLLENCQPPKQLTGLEITAKQVNLIQFPQHLPAVGV